MGVIGFAADWSERATAPSVATRLVTLRGSRAAIARAPGAALAVSASGEARDGRVIAEGRGLVAVLEGNLHDVAHLRQELGLDRDAAESAVLLGAYERWGKDLLRRLRGEYALVVWDATRRCVLAARDPFGVRPLYYVLAPDHLWIASDADQFVAAGLVEPVPDDAMAAEFLTRRFQSEDRSFFRDIKRLPPGHGLTGDRGSVRTFDYRALPQLDRALSSTDACHEAFRSCFFTAVRRRLSSDRPVLADLSGGCDSSSIVTVADRLVASEPGLAPALVAASAVYPGLPCDESVFIDAVARHIRSPVVRWDGTRAGTLELEEPVLAAPGNRVMMAGGTEGFVDIARDRGAHVVLSGAGGDLVGFPFGKVADELVAGHWRAAAHYLLQSAGSLRGVARRAYRLLGTLGLVPPEVANRVAGRRQRRPEWLTPLAWENARVAPAHAWVQHSFASRGQRIRWEHLNHAAIGLSTEMRQRHAARNGLEVRFPFLDWDLVAFVLALPFMHWPDPRPFARLHREALKADLPAEIYRRGSKAEFTSAVINRVTAQMGAMEALFTDRSWFSERFVHQAAARDLLARFRDIPDSRDLMSAYHLWATASVETWLRTVMRYHLRSPRSEHDNPTP